MLTEKLNGKIQKGMVFNMNYQNSNAEKLHECDREIVMINYAHRRNIFKQRLYGAGLVLLVLIACAAISGAELLLFLIPVGIYLMLTKKTVLAFERE